MKTSMGSKNDARRLLVLALAEITLVLQSSSFYLQKRALRAKCLAAQLTRGLIHNMQPVQWVLVRKGAQGEGRTS